jgi:hypothetical protein
MTNITTSYLYLIQEIEKLEMLTEQEILNEFSLSGASDVLKRIPLVQKFLGAYDIVTSDLQVIGRTLSVKAEKLYRSGVKPEEAGKILKKDLEKIIIKKLGDTLNLNDQITYAIFLGMLIGIVNFMCMTFLTGIAGAKIGELITAVIIAPMVEELAKNNFIKEKMPWLGTGIVFSMEFFDYVLKAVSMGYSFVGIVLIRLVGLLFHFLTTYIQKSIMDIKSEERTFFTENKAKIAWFTGVVMHASYNLLATIYSKEITHSFNI